MCCAEFDNRFQSVHLSAPPINQSFSTVPLTYNLLLTRLVTTAALRLWANFQRLILLSSLNEVIYAIRVRNWLRRPMQNCLMARPLNILVLFAKCLFVCPSIFKCASHLSLSALLVFL